MRSLCLILTFASACLASEVITLRNGFTLEARSHSAQNGVILVNTDAGSVEFPATDVAAIEILPERLSSETGPLAVSPKPADSESGPPAPSGKTPPDTESILANAATTQGLAPELVRSVAKVESGLRPDAVSPKGAKGLMQLMPGTAAGLNVSADVPAENAKGGAAYLRQLLLQYHGNAALALAAYNAGPGAVARFGGIPPYPETRRYVLHVLQELAKEQRKTPKTIN